MTADATDYTPWEAKVACALLVARADGRYELSERDVLSAYVSPNEPAHEMPLGPLSKGRLVVEEILEDWGLFLRKHLPQGQAETDDEKAPYAAYGRVLDRLDGQERPLEVLRACRSALRDPADREEAVALAYDVAKADGGVDPEEQAVFQRLVKVLGATDEEVRRARETVDELNAFQKALEAELRDLEEGEDAEPRRAPDLTPLEALAGIVPLALHADGDVDPAEHDAVEAFCDEHDIALQDFQDAIRRAQTARRQAGPLGLLEACADALASREERERALELARRVVAAGGTVGDEEQELLDLLEEGLG